MQSVTPEFEERSAQNRRDKSSRQEEHRNSSDRDHGCGITLGLNSHLLCGLSNLSICLRFALVGEMEELDWHVRSDQ